MREHDFGVSVGTGPKGGMQTRVRVHQDSKGRIHGHPFGPAEVLIVAMWNRNAVFRAIKSNYQVIERAGFLFCKQCGISKAI